MRALTVARPLVLSKPICRSPGSRCSSSEPARHWPCELQNRKRFPTQRWEGLSIPATLVLNIPPLLPIFAQADRGAKFAEVGLVMRREDFLLNDIGTTALLYFHDQLHRDEVAARQLPMKSLALGPAGGCQRKPPHAAIYA